MGNLTPFIVSGTITLSDGSHPNGVKVVARNDTTIYNINTTTNSSGQYVLDLANLTNGWNVGDSITIIVNDGLESGSSSFTITSSSVSQTVNITTSEILDSADVSYCTITDVYNELDGKTTTDISAERIRNNILRAEAEVDLRTGTSFKSNTVTDEVYDTNFESVFESANIHTNVGLARADGGIMSGTRVQLKHKPIISITSLSKNSAAATAVDSWTALTQHTGTVAGDYAVYKKKGLIEWLQNAPNLQRRAFKVSYTWGLDRTATDIETLRKIELVKELTILLTVNQILSTKSSSSLFNSVDSISLESISISKGTGDATGYMDSVKTRITELFNILGVDSGFSFGQIESDY